MQRHQPTPARPQRGAHVQGRLRHFRTKLHVNQAGFKPCGSLRGELADETPVGVEAQLPASLEWAEANPAAGVDSILIQMSLQPTWIPRSHLAV